MTPWTVKLRKKWLHWKSELLQLRVVDIPRCFRNGIPRESKSDMVLEMPLLKRMVQQCKSDSRQVRSCILAAGNIKVPSCTYQEIVTTQTGTLSSSCKCQVVEVCCRHFAYEKRVVLCVALIVWWH